MTLYGSLFSLGSALFNSEKTWYNKWIAKGERRNNRVYQSGVSERTDWIGERNLAEMTEGELIPLLRTIEERRKGNGDEELDLAEAKVLTRLAGLRMSKPGGEAMALDWLTRARELAPSFLPAAQLMCRLSLGLLHSRTFGGPFPPIRETDNAVKWRAFAARAERAAAAADDQRALTLLRALQRLYGMREELLGQLLQRAQTYAASIQGLFYSAEHLASVQQTVKLLGEQEEQRAQLFAELAVEEEAILATREPGALETVEALVGLSEIKQRVRQLARFHQYQQLRSEQGWQLLDPLPLHLVLMGNPGTGKTTLARLIARLYFELGLLERGDVVEVDRSHLVGAYVGQTEQRTMEVIKKAAGGVLFIDEAYSLKRADQAGNDYGQVVIDTLVAAMTGGEYAGRFVVILAGYPEEMRQFLMSNPGLRSRFPESGHFVLPDYSTDELVTIAEQVARRNDFALTDQTRVALRERLERERVDQTFGNARTAASIILDAIFAKGQVIDGKKPLQVDDFTILYPEDVLPGEWAGKPENHQQSAREILERLVGLDHVKAELHKIASFLEIQRERAAHGLSRVPIELHAVFTGNPGTGKTTVAQLYAEVLKETGYLKRGHLVSAGRADLVAGYVGQTAALTRRKIREALGGVLFIDEAYALASGGENDFGREAIHTLVEEMTKHQENLVVVLAGYPREMDILLSRNPGLASRFKKYIHFADYTADELCRIVRQGVQEAGYVLGADTEVLLAQALHSAAKEGILSGNGRLARNLVQEALQNQAVRLSMLPPEERTAARLRELIWEDFHPLFRSNH